MIFWLLLAAAGAAIAWVAKGSDDDEEVNLDKISLGLGSKPCSCSSLLSLSCSEGKTLHWCKEKNRLVFGYGDQRCKCGNRRQTGYGLTKDKPYSILNNYPLINLQKEEKKYSILDDYPFLQTENKKKMNYFLDSK